MIRSFYSRSYSESSGNSPPQRQTIAFSYSWTTKVNVRTISSDESTILIISPKFATVHDHVSFQWSVKIHGTSGLKDEEGEEEGTQCDYVAVELYLVDGPVSQVHVRATVSIREMEGSTDDVVQQSKAIKMYRGRGCEIVDRQNSRISKYIQESVNKVIHIAVVVRMDAKLFDPFTYLDNVSPTPHKSFLTDNYNARVNSQVWRRKSRRRTQPNITVCPKKEYSYYEKKFEQVMEEERERVNAERRKRLDSTERRDSGRRGSLKEMVEHQKDLPKHSHEHCFKKLLITCCESCEKRRASLMSESHHKSDESEEINSEADDESLADEEEERHFECADSGKEHVHDLLANMYFNKILLPQMEFVEDFVDFLIDAELNDLPVLKRACERYLCGELNSKKDLPTSLLLNLLFISAVFNLNVMKSMTISEISYRTDELTDVDKLLEQEDYRNIDSRMRTLADRSLSELIEQCIAFRDQRNRVVILPNDTKTTRKATDI